MIHKIADLSKISILNCLYHRTFMTVPYPTLLVSIDGEQKEFHIRYKAATKDKLYHTKGLPCTLVIYDGIVLAYEIHNESSAVSQNLNNLTASLESGQIEKDGWYFDGEKFYQLTGISSSEFVSLQNMPVIDPIHFTYESSIGIIENSCFVISSGNEIIFQTPPIATDLSWKKDLLGLSETTDHSMYINLNYLLKICDKVSKIYGPEMIERFDISQYMLRHKTVNLRKLPKNVLDNSTSYLTPVEAISYMCGLAYKENNHEKCLDIIKTLKQVVRSGIINARHSDAKNVFLEKVNLVDISERINLN